jgi:hypothetical protein
MNKGLWIKKHHNIGKIPNISQIFVFSSELPFLYTLQNYKIYIFQGRFFEISKTKIYMALILIYG